MKVIIADTSSLVLFSKIQKLEILRDLYSNLIITPEVAEEFGAIPDWIQILAYNNIQKFHELRLVLGKGEASAITLALETENSLLIMDEKKGRKIAEQKGLQIIGSLGTILLAKRNGKIESVKEILNLVKETDFRFSSSILDYILSEAGE